jgi:hypothetical protein
MLHTADYSANFTVGPAPEHASANLLDILPGQPTRDQLLCHLGALVWATDFTSVDDLLARGAWTPTIRFLRACDLKPVKLILATTEYAVRDEKELARAILEWVLLRSELMDAQVVLLWLYADWRRILIWTWQMCPAADGVIERAYPVPMAPHMPSGQDAIALHTQWAERAPVLHLLVNTRIGVDSGYGKWSRLVVVMADPVCELRRYDATQWTNVPVCTLVVKTICVHVVEFAPEDAPLPMGNFIYQIYPAQHNKRSFAIPSAWQKYSIYVYRRNAGAPDWIPCVDVAIDAGVWPYFSLPHDTTTGVLAIFAASREEADALVK